MMTQQEEAKRFAALHQKGNPVILYNIWDAGSALAVAESGAKALATGSWSVAAAQGHADGQKLSMAALIETARSIVAATDLPLSVDFEAGYAEKAEDVAANVSQLIDAGAIGMNFEDQMIGATGLYPVETQVARIGAVRKMADGRSVPFFINARTDVFLKEKDAKQHPALLGEAIARAKAYADAGASGFFAPGLADPALIEDLCKASSLPVNIMMKPGGPDATTLAGAGVGRISYGPYPYIAMIEWLKREAAAIYAAS